MGDSTYRQRMLTQRAPLYQTSAEDTQVPVTRVLILLVLLIGKDVVASWRTLKEGSYSAQFR